MSTRTTETAQRRVPLSRERVLQTAFRLADQGGLESVSMRKLGQELGVEGMAMYYYFANRDQIIDGIVDLVFAEIDLPAGDGDWKAAMRRRLSGLPVVPATAMCPIASPRDSASLTNRSTCACRKRLAPNWRMGNSVKSLSARARFLAAAGALVHSDECGGLIFSLISA